MSVLRATGLLLLFTLACTGSGARTNRGATGGSEGDSGGSTGGAVTGGAGGTGGVKGTGGAPASTGGAMGTAEKDAAVAMPPPPDAKAGPEAPPVTGAFPKVDSFDVDACHDLDIAVGPTVVGVATNPGVVNFYTKEGKVAYKTNPFPGAGVGDAHVSWDQSSKRFFFSTLQAKGGDAAWIAVSTDETGKSWSAPAKVMGPTDLDNPQLVVTTDKVSLLVFDCVYTMDKDAVMSANGQPIPSVKSCGIKHTDQTYGVDYGPTVPATAYFAVMSDDAHFNWITVEGTPKANDVKLTQHMVALSKPFTRVPAFPGVTAFGGMVTRNSGNLAEWHAGHLWWSQSGKCGADVCPRLFDVNTETGVARDFDLALPGAILWSCAPGLDKDGNMFALMAQTNGTTPLSLAVGGMTAAGRMIAPQTVWKGNGTFPAPEFGDFFDAAQDPTDGTVWAVGNYAAGGKCGARVVHITAQ
jgi:hypothetical protein